MVKILPKLHDHTPEEVKHGISPRSWILAGLAGLTSGVTAAIATVREKFYQELKNWPGFDSLFDQHAANLNVANLHHQGKPFGPMAEEIGGIKDKFADVIEEKLIQEHGIYSTGVRGLTQGSWQRVQLAGERTKAELVMKTLISAAIGTAATVTFFNSLAMRDNIEAIASKQDKHDRSTS